MYNKLIVRIFVLLVIKTEIERSLKKVWCSLIGHETFILHIISDQKNHFLNNKGPI